MCDDLSFRAAQEVLRPCRDVLGQGSASVLDLLVTECLMSVSAKQGPSLGHLRGFSWCRPVTAASRGELSAKASGANSRDVA